VRTYATEAGYGPRLVRKSRPIRLLQPSKHGGSTRKTRDREPSPVHVAIKPANSANPTRRPHISALRAIAVDLSARRIVGDLGATSRPARCACKITPAQPRLGLPVAHGTTKLICKAVLSSGHAKVVLIPIRTGDSHTPIAAVLTGVRSPVSRLAEGHPEGGLALTPARTTSRFAACGEWGRTVGSRSRVSVSLHDAWSRLICAGWLPQDRVFGWSVARV
jgi:hypothetical protein